jgi:hypothetical protein
MTRWLHGPAGAWLQWEVAPRFAAAERRAGESFPPADVAEQSGSKLIVRPLIDRADLSHSRLQQPFQPPVVFHKKVCDRPSLLALSRFHPWPSITPSTDLSSPRTDERLRSSGRASLTRAEAKEFGGFFHIPRIDP